MSAIGTKRTFICFWTKADKVGFWPAMVRPLRPKADIPIALTNVCFWGGGGYGGDDGMSANYPNCWFCFYALLPGLSTQQNGDEFDRHRAFRCCPRACVRHAPAHQTDLSVSSIHWFDRRTNPYLNITWRLRIFNEPQRLTLHVYFQSTGALSGASGFRSVAGW